MSPVRRWKTFWPDLDRYVAVYLQDRVGAEFPGRITGVTRFGLFVTLDDTGADGLVPMRSLPDDFYDHVEERHALVGRRWGRVYTLGERITAKLREASPVTGGLIMELVDEPPAGASAGRAPAPRSVKKNKTKSRPGRATGKKRPARPRKKR